MTGVDGSPTAIAHAQRHFASEGLTGDFTVGDFVALPFRNDAFHSVIDRGSLSCVGVSASRRALAEVWRVLKPGGRFFFNPYSARSTSAGTGSRDENDLTTQISQGSLTGVGGLRFYDLPRIREALSEEWAILSCEHVIVEEVVRPEKAVHAEWRVIAEKASA